MRAGDHHVVIVGGGFGGLYAAQALKRVDVRVTLVDRRNFHLFQPLLYQVAMGQLSPGDIASPLRTVLKWQRNTQVLMAEVVGIDVPHRRLRFSDGDLEYDTLILAAGSRHHYFGNDQWEPLAPGLKTIEDATEMRRRVLLAFEAAEREPDAARRHAWMTFVVVGAGPTGVELAGALGEIAHDTLRQDFRSITPSDAEIILLEAGERVLPPYVPALSAKAEAALTRLGVTVRNSTTVVGVEADAVTVRQGERQERIPTRTVLWAAGVQASPLGRILAEASGAKLDRAGRVIVEQDLSVSGHPEILVIGDLAHFAPPGGQPLPAVAPVAMAQGRYVADLIARHLRSAAVEPFRYRDKGMLATIGRSKAVADLGFVRFSGFLAWLAWLFIHLMYLVGFRNRVLVLLQWAWSYATRNRGARLITGPNPLPLSVSSVAGNGKNLP